MVFKLSRTITYIFTVKRPPKLCFKIPGLGRFARVCLEIYGVDLRRKRLCTRIVGELNLVVCVKYYVLPSVKVVTLISISGRGSAIASAKQGPSGSIYDLVKN